MAHTAYRESVADSAVADAVAVSAVVAEVCHEIRDYSAWRFAQVVRPCLRWCTTMSHEWKPISVGVFGSHHYDLALPSSDCDVVIVLAPPHDTLDVLNLMMRTASGWCNTAGGCFSCVAKGIKMGTLKFKYRSVWMDIIAVKTSRSTERSVTATDLLKGMLEARAVREGFVESILAFKLIAHHLRFIQWHSEARGEQFKAITLCFFAVAVLDQAPPSPVAASVAGVLLFAILRAFRSFDWERQQISVGVDGKTRIVKKHRWASAVCVYLDIQRNNSAYNVTMAHVQQCRAKLEAHWPIKPGLLRSALAEQAIHDKKYLIAQLVVHDAPPILPARPQVLSAPMRPVAASAAGVPAPQRAPPCPMPPVVASAGRVPVATAVHTPMRPPAEPPWAPSFSGLAQTQLGQLGFFQAYAQPPAQPAPWPQTMTPASPPSTAAAQAQAVTQPRLWPKLPLPPPASPPPSEIVKCITQTPPPPRQMAAPLQLVTADGGPLPDQLVGGTWDIAGERFLLVPPPNGDIYAPIVLFIAGAGGMSAKDAPQTLNLPLPSWSVVISMAGTYKVRTPPSLIQLLAFLRCVTRLTRNKIVVMGNSRGAAWVIDVAMQHTSLVDAVVAIAGYPWTKCKWTNPGEARELMQVQIPVLLVHFELDSLCSVAKYPNWYSTFADPAVPRSASFVSAMCEGTHSSGPKLLLGLTFAALSDPAPSRFWTDLWATFSGG
ncbi:MAG: nucleotidyltransferase domain-containing protein [Dehalococcoidia bacterium]|nr:nucleotidyltransferase domain-containing protein [Dehalococcoidia bacterium]